MPRSMAAFRRVAALVAPHTHTHTTGGEAGTPRLTRPSPIFSSCVSQPTPARSPAGSAPISLSSFWGPSPSLPGPLKPFCRGLNRCRGVSPRRCPLFVFSLRVYRVMPRASARRPDSTSGGVIYGQFRIGPPIQHQVTHQHPEWRTPSRVSHRGYTHYTTYNYVRFDCASWGVRLSIPRFPVVRVLAA